ncbi:DUF4440 domain-containing protein [Mesorhizobium sp. NPDC059054]|uniref:nuclear transport factor 2 family protein n=1 Tax=Mesorhizobium sp. NPDC059054 TaxID=3346711 RepID=UPI0036C451B2
MPDRQPDIAFFRSLEQSLHRPDIRRSRNAVGEWLADDFVEFGSSGSIYDKPTILDALAKEPIANSDAAIESDDFRMRVLSADAVLLTYRTVSRSSELGIERHALRSSIWQQIDGRWQMSFHQGTIVPNK